MKNNLAQASHNYINNPMPAALATPAMTLTDEIENSLVLLRDRSSAVGGELERIGDAMWGSQPHLASDNGGAARPPHVGRVDSIRDRLSELFRAVDYCETQAKRFAELAG